MRNIIKAIIRWVDKNFLTILLGYILVFIMIIGMTLYSMNDTIRKLEIKLDIYETKRQQEVRYLEEAIVDLATGTIKNNLAVYELNEIIVSAIEKIKNTQDIVKANLEKKKSIDLNNINEIKRANVLVLNVSQFRQGSGTHIKINNESYILSCAHLVTEPEDFIWAWLDDGNMHPLELVKINKKKDLVLFRIFNVEDLPSLEISKETPKEGSEVIVIGNPDNLTDVFTDGIITKVQANGYLLSNLIYFGNSGGALLYKGKIVGVMTKLIVNYEIPVFVNYAFSSNLDMIKDFLGDINEEKSTNLEK